VNFSITAGRAVELRVGFRGMFVGRSQDYK
jgi:hypothetical protein